MSISDMFNSMYEGLSMLYHSKLFGNISIIIIGFSLLSLPINAMKRAMRYSCHDLDRIENKKSWKYERGDI